MHLREAWEPMVFEYGTYGDWVKRGSMDPVIRANKKAKALLKDAKAVPLEKDLERQLREIVKKGEKELK
jgi:trimethylamine:corrinoid methyltransferase-like protein